MRKVIVTGANGFVGTKLVQELSKQQYEVYAVVKNEQSDIDKISDLAGVHIVFCDLRNITSLPEKLQEKDFDVFFHLAWTGSAGPLRADYEVQLENVRYTCDAVRTAHQLQCKRFVFAGTIAQYEIQETVSVSEKLGIGTIYGTGKTVANYMAHALADSLGVEYTALIISNIYGPGEYSPRLINSTIRKLLKGEETAFSAGTQMYDFIYVDDAVQAILAVSKSKRSDMQYYIGSQEPSPLRTFLEKIGNCLAPDRELGFGKIPGNVVSVDYSKLDVFAVERDTGFKNRVPFEEGIKLTADWILKEAMNENSK